MKILVRRMVIVPRCLRGQSPTRTQSGAVAEFADLTS